MSIEQYRGKKGVLLGYFCSFDDSWGMASGQKTTRGFSRRVLLLRYLGQGTLLEVLLLRYLGQGTFLEVLLLRYMGQGTLLEVLLWRSFCRGRGTFVRLMTVGQRQVRRLVVGAQ